MAQSVKSFDKFYQEANSYLRQLAEDLGHPDEYQRSLMIWRSVMHTIRDRIHLGESFDIMSSLPMVFKGIYADNWQYHEKPPLAYSTIEEMKKEVKLRQQQQGERDFDWDSSTENIISSTIHSLRHYLSDDHLEHLKGQLPNEVKELVG